MTKLKVRLHMLKVGFFSKPAVPLLWGSELENNNLAARRTTEAFVVWRAVLAMVLSLVSVQ